MDGGSTDETIPTLRKYEGKVKWFSERDKGQSDAINKGLKIATGDIVAWLNSDDYYLPGTLKKIVDIFEKNKNIQWISGDYQIIDEKGKEIQLFVRIYKKFLARFFPLSFANFINQPSTFWRKSFQDIIGYLNEDLRYCMDYDLWLRFMKQSPVHLVSAPLSVFRIHKASKGGSQYERQFEEELEVAKKYNNNILLQMLHKTHNKLINMIYNHIK